VGIAALGGEARERAESSGIVFVDEIDKIVAAQSKQGPDVSREGVQRDLLPIVEGSSVGTKHGVIKTDHILFVAAGAFHGTSPTDLIPETRYSLFCFTYFFWILVDARYVHSPGGTFRGET